MNVPAEFSDYCGKVIDFLRNIGLPPSSGPV